MGISRRGVILLGAGALAAACSRQTFSQDGLIIEPAKKATPNPELDLSPLGETIAKQIRDNGDYAGVAITDLQTSSRATYQGNRKFEPEGVINLYLMMDALENRQHNPISELEMQYLSRGIQEDRARDISLFIDFHYGYVNKAIARTQKYILNHDVEGLYRHPPNTITTGKNELTADSLDQTIIQIAKKRLKGSETALEIMGNSQTSLLEKPVKGHARVIGIESINPTDEGRNENAAAIIHAPNFSYTISYLSEMASSRPGLLPNIISMTAYAFFKAHYTP